MSLFDLIQRTEAILKKYEKYDQEFKPSKDTGDAFLNEVEEVESEIRNLMEAAEEVQMESSRPLIAAKNAEIRRAKNILLTEAVDSLKRKAKKGKRLKKETIAEREEMIKDIIDKIYGIPDGMSSAPIRRPHRAARGGKKDPIILDSSGAAASSTRYGDNYYTHTEQTQAFETEKEAAFRKQDEVLGRIEKGVDTLKEIATNMGEEVDRQNPVIDDIENAIDKNLNSLKTNNAKLKGLVHKMRSARNICVDIVLVCILLSIGGYIYSQFGVKK